MKKSLATAAIAASTLGGVAAGAALFTPVVAGAQDAEETVQTSRLSEALQGLVDDGTITDAQRTAVVDTLEAARAEHGFGGERGPRGHRGGMGGGGEIAEILGMDPTDVRDALQSGQSIADLAEANGISTDTIVDAIVANMEEHIGDAVDSGRIDQDRADEMLAGAEARAEAMLNGEMGPGNHGGMRGGGMGGGMPGADADA